MTTIRIAVDDKTITAQLADNPTAQDLAAQLPLTLSIRDFNRLEKVAKLPRPLTMDGVPPGAQTPRSTTSATTPPQATSSSTTATSATSTASSASAASAAKTWT